MTGYNQAKQFYESGNLPCGAAAFVGSNWRSFIDAQAEFCFEFERESKREHVCVVLYEKDLTSSEEELDDVLRMTLEPAFHKFQPCDYAYGLGEKGGGSAGPRKWRRD